MNRDQSIERALSSRFGVAGDRAASNVVRWSNLDNPLLPRGVIQEAIHSLSPDEIFDEFWTDLAFGTGGRRGPVGIGPNRINLVTAIQTVQGHCDYMLSGRRPGRVVVANDVRIFSDQRRRYTALPTAQEYLSKVTSRGLAELSAAVYAVNGFDVYMRSPGSSQGYMTTPLLSFLIRELRADGGINISASHNHPDDNGLKLYDSSGAQYTPPSDQRLLDAMVNARAVAPEIEFSDLLRAGRILDLPADLENEYHQQYVNQLNLDFAGRRFTERVVFTPLSGCADENVGETLRKAGFLTQTPPGHSADGSFSHIPLLAPNPEVPEATKPAQEYADGMSIGLVLSADPDGDRLGVDVLADGKWHHLTGNQIGVILAYFLLADPKGPQKQGTIIQTIVTSPLIAHIGHATGNEVVDDLLVGFKYIARSIEGLAASADPDKALVLAVEESHGYLTTARIRDKDAASAAAYIAGLYELERQKGRSLIHYLDDCYAKFGAHYETARSIVSLGSSGATKIAAVMSGLRSEGIPGVGGQEVRTLVDYLDEERYGPIASATDQMARDVLQFTSESYVLTVRPSGTEPKLKFYLHWNASKEQELYGVSHARLQNTAAEIYSCLLGFIDVQLSEMALRLPDLVSLEEKISFDANVAPMIRALLKNGESPSSVVSQVSDQCIGLLPGVTPAQMLNELVAFAAETGV